MLDSPLLFNPHAGECEIDLRGPSRLGNAAFLWLPLCLGFLALCFAEPARAIPYTLAAAIPITGSESGNPGVVGSLEPVALDGSLSDPLGLTDGDVSFLTNDVFLVRLVLASGSAPVDSLGIGANSTPFFGNPVGAGAYADASQAPSGVTASSLTLMGLFDFIPDTLDAGESSVRLFVTYNPVGSALAVGSVANFMIHSGTTFTVQGTMIPEPRSALLLAMGVLWLTLRDWRGGAAPKG